MPIDKTKAKEKLKGKMREVIKASSYFGEPNPMSEEQRQQRQANRESYSKGDKIRGIGNVHQFKKTKRKKGEIVPPPVPVPR